MQTQSHLTSIKWTIEMSGATEDSKLAPIPDNPNKVFMTQDCANGISAEFKRNQRKYENYVFK